MESDRIVFGDVVDHKMPVQDGGKVHCVDAGLWTLCKACHGWKGRLEDFARKTGQLAMLVMWCDEPASRPRFRGEIENANP